MGGGDSSGGDSSLSLSSEEEDKEKKRRSKKRKRSSSPDDSDESRSRSRSRHRSKKKKKKHKHKSSKKKSKKSKKKSRKSKHKSDTDDSDSGSEKEEGEHDDSRDNLIEDNPEKGKKKFLIEELNNKDIDSSDVDITAMLDEIEEDMDLDELVRQKALLQEKLKKDGIDGISDDELNDEKDDETEKEEVDKEDDTSGKKDDVEYIEIVESSSDSDVEHLISLDRRKDRERRSESGRRDPKKDLLKDR